MTMMDVYQKQKRAQKLSRCRAYSFLWVLYWKLSGIGKRKHTAFVQGFEQRTLKN